MGPRRKKTCLRRFANNTSADQPAHPCSLISAFVIHLLKSIISRLATSEISLFYLVSVTEETGLSLALSETPKTMTGFVATRPICDYMEIITLPVFCFQSFEECQKIMVERGNLFLKKLAVSRQKIAKLAHRFISDGSVSSPVFYTDCH